MTIVNRLNSATQTVRSPRYDLVIVVALELALVVALHLTASAAYSVPLQSLPQWFQSTDPTIALVALARIMGLAIGYWLLTTTVAYAIAHHLGWQAVTDGMRWFTLPVVRRMVQGVTAMSLTGFSLMGPAAVSVGPAMAQTEAVVVQDADGTTSQLESEIDEAPASSDYQPGAAGWPDTSPEGSGFWIPAAITQADGSAATHVVKRHEHLWSIAEDQLRKVVGRDVTEDEICQYWVRVVEVNRGRLISGDPDLIYPDETVSLPPVFER